MHDRVSKYLIVQVVDYAMAVFLHIIAPLFGVSYYSGIFCSVFFLAAVHLGMLCLKVNGGNVMERSRWGERKSPLISVE